MLMKKRVMKKKNNKNDDGGRGGLFDDKEKQNANNNNSVAYFDFDNDEENVKKSTIIKPLLVFVNPVNVDENYDRKHAASWAMYFRLFPDFPWASVLSSSGLFMEDYMRDVLTNIQGRENDSSSSSFTKLMMETLRNTSNDHREGHGMLCFRQGFAWQTCRK